MAYDSPTTPVIPLSTSTSRQIRSSLLIPTIPQLLSELLHNSLDVSSRNINIYIDISQGFERLRVEDDGSGISLEGLREVGMRYRSSKHERWGEGGGRLYGFRGEALASIGALSLLEITTKPKGSKETYSKVIKSSKVLFEGISTRSLGRESGTTITVKDLFHDIPIRQQSLLAASNTVIPQCKKVIEILALVRPEVKWTLWEQKSLGTSTSEGLKKVLGIYGGKSSIDVFRAIYGNTGVEKVQTIRVSSGKRRIDGFISLQGAISRNHQHLYSNGYPIEKGDLHLLINQKFSRSKFSEYSDDSTDTFLRSGAKKSPRRLDRYPTYVLNIHIQPDELDAAYTPNKMMLGYKDEDAIKAFLGAVVDEFLQRHGFVKSKVPVEGQQEGDRTASTPIRTNSRSQTNPQPHQTPHIPTPNTFETPKVVYTPLRSETPVARPDSTPHAKSYSTTPSHQIRRPLSAIPPSTQGRLSFPQSSGKNLERKRKLYEDYTIDSSGRKRYKWVDEIFKNVDSGVFPLTPKITDSPHTLFSIPKPSDISDTSDCSHCSSRHHKSRLQNPLNVFDTQISFAKECLSTAKVLDQVDDKFIATVVESKSQSKSDQKEKTLILIDQHAADERISVETLLKEICHGFLIDEVDSTLLTEPVPAVILSKEEADKISLPGVLEIFARWGIYLDSTSLQEKKKDNDDFVQVPILLVPTALKARLGRKEASEMTRLIRLHLEMVDHTYLREVDGIFKRKEKGEEVDWGEVLRFMPEEMLNLVNSKACRSSIMFGDKLSYEQCVNLISKLGETRFPFMCAHGRPSLVPIMRLEIGKMRGRREIDWGRWRGRVGQEVD